MKKYGNVMKSNDFLNSMKELIAYFDKFKKAIEYTEEDYKKYLKRRRYML